MARQSAPAAPQTAEEERAKSKNIGALKTLFPYIAPYRTLLVSAGVVLVLTAFLSLLLPMAVRRVVDGFDARDTALLDQYFGAAIAVAALLALGTGLRYYLVTRLGERVVADIRKSVFDRTLGMSPAFFEKIMTGEVLSRLTTDTTLILSVISSSVSIALRNFLILIGGMILMLLTSGKLTGLVLLLVPLVLVPIVVLGRKLRKLSRINQDWIAASSGNASEALTSVQTVQAFTHVRESRAEFDRMTELSFDSAKQRIGVRAAMTVIVIFLIFTGIVGVLWMGARDVRDALMTPGELVQFVIYAIMVAGSVGALSEIWGELQRAAGATERLVELLTMKDTVEDPENPRPMPANCEGRITFEDVSFTYPARPGTPVLDEIAFDIRPGETVALVGPSGAGKSTILQLLLRFFDPDEGRIKLDGIDLRDARRDDFRRKIAFVPQDAVIFATSARENIRFGRPDATDAEVEAAAKAAAADEFLSRLPDGYETFVGERGVMLSGGQKQRIAIARAILRDAPVLLLDEATSALDAESEQAVQHAVEQLSEGRTTLIVAHRLATVKKADRILVFERGRIVAEGTHDALVAQGGLYARLARLQFTAGLAAE
ncbi:lipid A ABC exporter family [Dinoroseobacter shibae DFL 12 = DSM 16493]|jgi:ATP-binding cassette subfamily B protein|uniref:Lipid A ABC exporter family n=1 Tax=Dinoroseobacter shibae (strain DSM 16493 / NCIMB 14021 / DFL 12) TaxID=398580 RepID=A8LRE7_DINSH|nr:ABC transporter transmembrane domain-containing protein [Dinoroseobacter shibae]ABV92597.1 lipid A ABC exporter family [Dinoroseobacter shibae DFL 12 = DSM 16493]URF47540.1 ABC transporter transmembrane domain-containing protein [Dinoroseobacter shibae]URF51850.1 ABC transporter transmembrane domain-containing protein [Dinoroseobacter shibae]